MEWEGRAAIVTGGAGGPRDLDDAAVGANVRLDGALRFPAK